jgi:hypothetical protein
MHDALHFMVHSPHELQFSSRIEFDMENLPIIPNSSYRTNRIAVCATVSPSQKSDSDKRQQGDDG